MRLAGFNFNKINAERLSDRIENLKINTKIDVSEINAVKSDFLKTKEELIGVKFKYNIDYDPDFAKIELAGNILLAVESKMARGILKQWKNKKMSEDFKITLFNFILRKSNLKALQLEDEMNFPLHISFPTLKKQKSGEK
ncbi:hypothetical protein ES703_93416 [subsurface metagenome]